MRKLYLTLLLPMSLLLFGVQAQATPMTDFTVTGANVNISDVSSWSWGDPTATLSSGLLGTSFSLAEGESRSFAFFNLYLPKGYGSANIAAGLELNPPGASGTGSGSGSWWSLGLLSGGDLTWNQPGLVRFGDGGEFYLTFENLRGITLGKTVTVHATVTSKYASVPEPSTLALFGVGLLAMGLVMRRRKGMSA